MQTVLIVVHLLIVLALIGVVLLQRSEGGLGLSSGSGGVSGFMTGRGQTNALTRATAILAGLFFLTSLALAIMAHRNQTPRSILDNATPAAPAANAPAGANPQGPGVLEQLQRMQQPATPATPGATPAAPSNAQQAPAPAPAPSEPSAPQSR